MIDPLIRWSLRNRWGVLLLGAILLVLGGYTAVRMPVDVFPDLTAPTVTVITDAHGMAPAEVEAQITFPIESAMNGASGVRRVRSSTAVGISVVWVEFEWGTKIAAARQVVSEKLALVANQLPPEVQRPILAPVSSIMGEILFIALTSEQQSATELRRVADTMIRPRLLSMAGVSQVTPIGGAVKQYQVVLDPERLAAENIRLGQVLLALEKANQNISAGFVQQRGAELVVTGMGRFRSKEEIAETLVEARGDAGVTVGDLGEVVTGVAPQRGTGSANGKPAVILGIQKQPDANTLELTERLDRELALLATELPEGIELNRQIFRQADFISIAVGNVTDALRDGAVLVVLVVLVFLANTRATLITVLAIPLSLLVAVLILKAFGATINTMTLGGMAISIGALVDDAVIDVENVFRRLRQNIQLPEVQRRSSLEVVYHASVEIRSSIFFATLIIVLVFTPLFFLSGVEGLLLRPLGIAYVTALLASLLVAVTITPVLCLLLLPKSRAVQTGQEARLVQKLKEWYGPVLGKALDHPWAVTVPVMVLFGMAIASIPFMGRSFLPEFNEGALTISAVTVPGISLEESDRLGRIIEEALLEMPEVISVGRRTGRAELDEHAQGVEASELDVTLKMGRRSKAAFLEALRAHLATIPGVNITIGQPISHRIDHMLSGTRANLAVKIFGEHLPSLRDVAEKVREQMSQVEGVVDLSIEPQIEIPALTVRYDRQAMARHGLSSEDVGQYLEGAVQGIRVTKVREGRSSVDVVVKLSGTEESDLERLQNLTLLSPSGGWIALKMVAEVRRETTPNMISREQVERKIVVMCNFSKGDVASVVEEVKQRVDPIVGSKPGYRVEYSGQFESAQEARTRLLLLTGMVLIGIFLLLKAAFQSVRDAGLVMINLPFALIGGVAGVFIKGGVLSVASLIGFITVFGIATRNGIMLISHVRHLQEKEGVKDFREAVFRGAMERLAPIMMTALATALALIPLALGGDKPGNEIETPMAIVILFGLLSSLIMNMALVPALYFRWSRPVPAERREI